MDPGVSWSSLIVGKQGHYGGQVASGHHWSGRSSIGPYFRFVECIPTLGEQKGQALTWP